MKKDMLSCEIVLPRIINPKYICLNTEDIQNRRRKSSLKLTKIMNTKFQADVMMDRTKMCYLKSTIDEKIDKVTKNLLSLYSSKIESSRYHDTESSSQKVKNIHNTSTLITGLNESTNFKKNGDFLNCEKYNVKTTKLQRKYYRKEIIKKSIDLDFKYVYKNKSVDEMTNKKSYFNKLFKSNIN